LAQGRDEGVENGGGEGVTPDDCVKQIFAFHVW
jgi:hypothetical protein